MYLVCRLLLEKKKRTLRSSSCPRWMLRARTTASSAHQRSAVTRSRSCACARPSPGWPRSILRFPGSGASSLSLFWPGPPRSPTLFPYTTLFRSLKTIADHLGLTPGTVSAALNNSPAARSIPDRKSTRLNSSHRCISYAVFCLKKKRELCAPRAVRGGCCEPVRPHLRRTSAPRSPALAPVHVRVRRPDGRAPSCDSPALVLRVFRSSGPAHRDHLHSFPTRRSSDLSRPLRTTSVLLPAQCPPR